jgi:hypothetical protein
VGSAVNGGSDGNSGGGCDNSATPNLNASSAPSSGQNTPDLASSSHQSGQGSVGDQQPNSVSSSSAAAGLEDTKPPNLGSGSQGGTPTPQQQNSNNSANGNMPTTGDADADFLNNFDSKDGSKNMMS